MDDLLALLLFTAPFALLGGGFGYLTRRGEKLPVALFVVGLGLTVFGLVALASIGVAIYPLGVIFLSMAIGRSVHRWVGTG
jgi:hypothetical protein